MLKLVFLRKADTYEKVRETCLEYGDDQIVFASQGEQINDQTRSHQPACYKKEADEARSKADKDKTKEGFPKIILKEEVEPEEEEKKKPVLFVQEKETQENEEEVLMKRLATEEPVQKHTRIEQTACEDADKVVGATRVRRRTNLTPFPPKKRKFQFRRRKILAKRLQSRC